MKKLCFVLVFTLLVSGCISIFPRMNVNLDHLPPGEIKEFIWQHFPSLTDTTGTDSLKALITQKLDGNHSPENIKRTVSDMGMTCDSQTGICEYHGYILTEATHSPSGNSYSKRIYHIHVDANAGMDSFFYKQKN